VDRVTVAIALGSNLGDRRAHLERAIERLRAILTNLHASSIIETDPVAVPDYQPPYLNAMVVGETALEPEALLDALRAIERDHGRARPSFRAARTLDLDVILHGDLVRHTGDLEIPHPRFRERMFVLEPLNEIAPDLIDPETGLTVEETLKKAEGRGQKAEVSPKAEVRR